MPTVFVENRRIVNLDPTDPVRVGFEEKTEDLPTGKENQELLTSMYSHVHGQTIVKGVSWIGYMTGGKAVLWRDEDSSDRLVAEAIKFMEGKENQSFFLHFSSHDIHVPGMAHERYQDKSGFGPRGDVILRLGEAVGMLLAYLEKEGPLDSTMIIFSGDNGSVWDYGYVDQAYELIGAHNAA